MSSSSPPAKFPHDTDRDELAAEQALISWAIVGHEARLDSATTLARALDAVVTIDDGSAGADANHIKAWDITSTLESQWAAVLEDDALPVPGFLEQTALALSSAPTPIVSFYLGRGKPRQWQTVIPTALQRADQAGAHWATSPHLLHAVAVAMSAELREDWLDFAPSCSSPIDERLTKWAMMRGHLIGYTVPSLVEHADGPTLIAHPDRRPRDMDRVAWRTGRRDRWNRITVAM